MNNKFAKTGLVAVAAATALWFGSAAQAGQDVGLHGWAGEAGNAVEKVMTYPRMAIKRGAEGAASFRVTVDREGNVVGAERQDTSGSILIKTAARNVISKAQFPALPEDFSRGELTFSLRLTYAIAGSSFEKRALEREAHVTGREVAKSGAPMLASIQIEGPDAE